MVKKKSLIFFVILLLTLFVGLSSSCYAFTEDDCKSLIYNTYVKAWNWNSNQVYSEINAINWSSWNSFFDNDDYQLLYTANSGTIKLFVRYKSGKPYNYNNTIWGTSWKGMWYNYKNISSITSNPSVVNATSEEWYGTGNVYYTEFDVYTASNSDTKLITAGSSNRTWLFDENEYNKREVFGFQEVETNTHVKLYSDGVSMPLYYSVGSSLYFADFVDDDGTGQTIWGKNLVGDELYMYYYTTNNWNGSVNLFRRDFVSIADFKTNRYINVTRNGSYTNNKLSLNSSYILTNVVYNYIINYEEEGISKFINYYFYIGDSNTNTIDGVIDVPTSIPDLDTYHNRIGNTAGIVNNNDNTDDIVNTIKSGDNNLIGIITDDSNVDNILADTFSGDLAEKLGYNALNNPYTDFLVNFTFDLGDLLFEDKDVYFDYSMHGEPVTRIYSSSFVTPNTPLKIFIQYSMIFGVLYVIYCHLRRIIDLINSGNAPMVLQEEDADIYFYKM